MAIEIVDFPIKNGGSFHCYVSLPEGIQKCFFPCCMTHSASHAPMDFAIGGGYVQPQRSPREATIRWAFMPPDVSQGRGERRGLPIDAGCGRGREFEESLGQGALRRDG